MAGAQQAPLTGAVRSAPAGFPLGVDLSSKVFAYAPQHAAEEGLNNITFQQVDAQIHLFETGAFDLAISRTSAMLSLTVR